MKKYTIGIVFDQDFDHVMLIKKVKPEWQKGLLNAPGGKIEEGELPVQCVVREIKEETNLDIPVDEWKYIGVIKGEGYFVDVFTAIYFPHKHGDSESMTEELIEWTGIDELLYVDTISNINWLVHFAMNCLNQGNADNLIFGTFEYK